MLDLTGLNALVTGGSGAIGSAIAKKLAAAGAKVAISGTRIEKLEEVCHEIGENAFPVPCNLKNHEEVIGLIPNAEKILGHIDILVNNAGITKDGLMILMKDEQYQNVIDLNLNAPFFLMRANLRGMMKRRFGRIINISSVVGYTGNSGQVNYSAAKAGLVGMTKSLASEVSSRGITVNCIAPGFVVSPMTDALNDEQKEKMLANIPVGSFGEPDDIAAAAVFLASKDAKYITGQTIHVNGGMAML